MAHDRKKNQIIENLTHLRAWHLWLSICLTKFNYYSWHCIENAGLNYWWSTYMHRPCTHWGFVVDNWIFKDIVKEFNPCMFFIWGHKTKLYDSTLPTTYQRQIALMGTLQLYNHQLMDCNLANLSVIARKRS